MPKPIFNPGPQFIRSFGPIMTYEYLQTLEGINEFVKGARCPKKKYIKPSVVRVGPDKGE